MTTWLATTGDLLEIEADALICSANPQLNLSGGVGGAILLRYGEAMQKELHAKLRTAGLPYLNPGAAVATSPCGTKYRTVIHAVAIDGFYDTSPRYYPAGLLSRFRPRSATQLPHDCGDLPCLWGMAGATLETFLLAVHELCRNPIPRIERVELRSTNSELVQAIQDSLAKTN
jgi:hypothetical protein